MNSPNCLTCGVEESPNHVFWECGKFESAREVLWRDIVRIRGSGPHSVEYFLASLSTEVIVILNKSRYLYLISLVNLSPFYSTIILIK